MPLVLGTCGFEKLGDFSQHGDDKLRVLALGDVDQYRCHGDLVAAGVFADQRGRRAQRCVRSNENTCVAQLRALDISAVVSMQRQATAVMPGRALRTPGRRRRSLG